MNAEIREVKGSLPLFFKALIIGFHGFPSKGFLLERPNSIERLKYNLKKEEEVTLHTTQYFARILSFCKKAMFLSKSKIEIKSNLVISNEYL